MKTKTLRLPMLFASAGAIICTVSASRAADAAFEVRQDQSTTQKEVINEPSGADRTYSSSAQIQTAPSASYSSTTYDSGAALDPDAEGNRIMHMYQRGRHAAESLDRQIKPNPIVVMPQSSSVETSASVEYPPNHLSELHQQNYSSSTFSEPAAAERDTTTSSTTSRRYTTSENTTDATAASSSTAMLSSGTTIKASDLIGMNIKTAQGERVGEVKDFVIDLKSGRVAYAVVSAGGIAGIGDKWLAVPPTVFTRTGTERTLSWDIDKEKLNTAPTIDKHNWNAAFQQDYIGNVYSFYGVQGYEGSDVAEPAGSPRSHDSQFHHDSDKQDKQDNRDQGQKQDQGQQQDKDQSKLNSSSSSADVKGQAAGASTEASQQSDLQKSQPEKSSASATSSDVSKDAAGAQPSSSTYKPSDAQSSSSSSDLKSSTDTSAAGAASSSTLSTEPQSGANASQSATVKDAAGATTSGSTEATTSENAAETSSSGSLTDKAQMALKNDASLSGSAQNVQFSMNEDKLVIKGTVKSEDEKNRIMEKVRATAGSTQIDDQLKVNSSDDSSGSSSSSSSDDTNK